MKTTDILRHLAGYFGGTAVFCFLIPYGLVRLALIDPVVPSAFPGFLPIRLVLALPVFIPGLPFMIWSNVFLFKIGRGGPAEGFNVAVSPPTKHLVVDGPYRFSRNPMVFGAFAVYTSIGLFFLSPACLVVLTAFLFAARAYLRRFEETRLLLDFGDAYAIYRARVPMIFPSARALRRPAAGE